jgi:hypothetical protein
VCAAAIFAVGCHSNNRTSGFGIAWVTLSATPGDFASYIVKVDSVTLTGKAVGVITAVSTVETVDFTKLNDISELWSSASIPNDTYTSATITLDYTSTNTSTNISVMVNGAPQKATIVDSTGAAVTTIAVTVNFDPNNLLVIAPTFASSSAQRIAIDFDLPASNVVNLATSPATVTVKPFITVATSAPDNKPVRVRGPLINSSVNVGTYSVYVRPFFDAVSSLGSLTIFNGPNTLYQINGTTYVGSPGLSVLSQLSAGTTMTAAYTTYQPTATPSTSAAKFNATYVIGGSTLEDFYTQGLEGDVIARSGNTLTLSGSTLQLNDGTSSYNDANAVLLVGPNTIVTAENDATLTGLNYNSVAVGQHIIARGIYQLPASGVVTLDSTGATATNTGSVRIQSTQLYGSLVASASGSLVLDLQTIDNWPTSAYSFAGNGASAAQDSVPASYVVNTGTLAATGAIVGDPLWINGFTTAFGSAPPDFNATAVNTELSVPASLQVNWTSAGTITPFATLTSTGLTINLADTSFSSGVIRVGSESIDLKSLAANPQIVPQATPAGTAGVPAAFLPLFAVGNPKATTGINVYNTFATFAAKLPTVIVAATPALQFVATGVYNRVANTFTASSIDVVL